MAFKAAQLALSAAALGALVFWGVQKLRSREAEQIAALPAAERGQRLMDDAGCGDCHQAGSAFRAPILQHLYGKAVRLEGGGQVVADEAYLRRALTAPKAEVVQGYQAVMPSYEESFSADELDAIIAAMK